MTDTLRTLLPGLYQPLLPEVFDTTSPAEPKATCATCAMCPPKDAPPPTADVTYFRPDAKCCTFEPRLPSYLVGAILADERPDMAEGRRRVRAKIAAKIGATPRWLAPPAKREVLMSAAWRNGFGRSLTLLCPYFEREGGLCTVWRHREAVCSTFFCKYDAAADGEHFWKSVRSLVGYVERVLSLHVTRELLPGYEPPAAQRDLTLEELEDRPPSENDYQALRGAWAGREEELTASGAAPCGAEADADAMGGGITTGGSGPSAGRRRTRRGAGPRGAGQIESSRARLAPSRRRAPRA